MTSTPITPIELFDAGLTDLIPVREGGKAPAIADWRTIATTREQVRRWMSSGLNVGLRADRVPGFDVDVTDPQLATTITSLLTARIGGGPIREGALPKVLLPFRLVGDATLVKHRLVLDGIGAVEVLASGQQYVVHGLHPKGMRYAWMGDPVTLPSLTGERAIAILREVADVLEVLGYPVRLTGRPLALEDMPVADRAPSLKALADLMAALPNHASVDRDQFVAIARAVKFSVDAEVEEAAFDLWKGWARRWEGGDNPEETLQRVWDSLHDSQIGWNYLTRRLQEWAPTVRAQMDFANAPPLPASGDDEGRQIAALHRSPERVFLAELPELSGSRIAERYAELRDASRGPHALDASYTTLIKGMLDHASVAETNPALFERLARAAGASDLLYRAAWLDCVPRRVLTATTERPKQAVLVEHAPLLATPDEEGKALIGRGTMTALVGPPGAGKSFVALALAHAVSSPEGPETFMGHTIASRGPVWYFASEFASGLINRLAKMPGGHRVTLLDAVPDLLSMESTLQSVQVASALSGTSAPALVVIDIMADALKGDENEAGTMGLAMLHAQAIARMTEAAVLIVHHATKADPEEPRGSSAFRAKLDQLFSVTLDEDGRTFVVRRGPKGKHREGLDLFYRFHVARGVLTEGADPGTIADHDTYSPHRAMARDAARATQDGVSLRQWAKDRAAHYEVSERQLRRLGASALAQIAVPEGWVHRDGATFTPGPVPVPEAEAEDDDA